MDLLIFLKKKSIYFRIILLISFIIYIYKSYPTPLSQQQGSNELFFFDKKQSFIGTVKSKYRGDHYVPYVKINNSCFSIDDSTFSKCKVGDSIIKKANDIYYVIYRDGFFYDSINIEYFYEPSSAPTDPTAPPPSK